MQPRPKRRAIVVGGSIAGLFTAAFLRRIGWQVEVYERSSIELIGRGVGIFATHLELFALGSRLHISQRQMKSPQGVRKIAAHAILRSGEAGAMAVEPGHIQGEMAGPVRVMTGQCVSDRCPLCPRGTSVECSAMSAE